MSFFQILLTTGGGDEILYYTPSTGDKLFDIPRSYGFNGVPEVGDIVIDDTDIKDSTMIKILHNDGVEPTFTFPGGITASKIAGNYFIGVDNEIYLIAHKGSGDVVDMISYVISPNLL